MLSIGQLRNFSSDTELTSTIHATSVRNYCSGLFHADNLQSLQNTALLSARFVSWRVVCLWSSVCTGTHLIHGCKLRICCSFLVLLWSKSFDTFWLHAHCMVKGYSNLNIWTGVFLVRCCLCWDMFWELFWHRLSLTVLVVLAVLENNMCSLRERCFVTTVQVSWPVLLED